MDSQQSKSVFEKNLSLFARANPLDADQVRKVDAEGIEWVATLKGEPNLKAELNGTQVFYHSQGGAAEEARKWLAGLMFRNAKALFLYGLGLGYHYDAAKEWLHSTDDRFLIFLEPDFRVVRRFLETERASEMLDDPQVIIKPFVRPGDLDWGGFRESLGWIFRAFGMIPFLFTATEYLLRHDHSMYEKVRLQVEKNLYAENCRFNEIVVAQARYFDNYYPNLCSLPGSTYGHDLFGKFAKVPAVICGAGPSLAKHLNRLKGLSDRAVVFGAATGLNVLTHSGIFPHLGAALDPNPVQMSRMMTHYGYETPFFFKSRFHHETLPKIHGPRLFVKGSGLQRIAEWMEPQLGLPDDSPVTEFLSTSHFCLILAIAMGCDPIILLGVDLSSPANVRYAPGVKRRPGDNADALLDTDAIPYNYFAMPGFDGKPVLTSWEWMDEAVYFSEICAQNPNTTVLNSNEGGLSIIGIPNQPFQEAVDRYLGADFDIEDWIYCQIASARKLEISHDKICSVLEEWKSSLQRCASLCQNRLELLFPWLERAKNSEGKPWEPDRPLGSLPDEIAKEPAGTYLLERLNEALNELFLSQYYQLDYFPEKISGWKRALKQLSIEIDRCAFLKGHAEMHIQKVEGALRLARERQNPEEKQEAPRVAPIGSRSDETYVFDAGRLIIQDPEMGLNLSLDFSPRVFSTEEKKTAPSGRTSGRREKAFRENGRLHGEYLLYHENGALQARGYYKDGLLHGPFTFYHPQGNLLSEAWHIEGKRTGKSRQYYPSGILRSLQRYKEGKRQGAQEYFYEDGAIKTLLNYSRGELHGDVRLFYPDGKPERQLHFLQGKLHGAEKEWDAGGQLLMEAEYSGNQPVGKARRWHTNGKLAQEVVYRGSPEHFDLFEWDQNGTQTQKKLYVPENYSADILSKSAELKDAVAKLKNQLGELQNKKNEAHES